MERRRGEILCNRKWERLLSRAMIGTAMLGQVGEGLICFATDMCTSL